MKQIKKMIYVLLALCIILPFTNEKVYASTGKISFSDPSVTVGSQVSVTVNVSTSDGSALGGVDLTLAYDASALEFVSGSSASGDAGTVRIVGVIDDASTTSLSYTLKFNTLKAGTSKITVSSYEVINLDYEPVEISQTGNSTVTVKEEETSKASADCKLASLQISPGTLSPAFSPTTVEYSTTVVYETTKLAISATPNDSNASITSVTGTDLSVGANTVRVTVTAENGASVAYVINVTRQAQVQEESTQEESSVVEPSSKEESSETEEESVEPEEEAVQVSVGYAAYTVLSDIPEEIIPSGFEEASYTYQDTEVSVLQATEGNVLLFYLESEEGAKELYLYDEALDTFTKYIPIFSDISLIALEPDESVTVSEGYTLTTVIINDEEVVAYQNNENTDFYLIYAMNAAGEKSLYQYDSVEGSLQRYMGTTTVTEEDSDSEDSSEISILQNQLQKLNSDYSSKMQIKIYILYGLAALIAILLIIVINLIVKLHDSKLDLEEEEEENNFDTDIEHREKSTGKAKEETTYKEEVKQPKKEKSKKKKQKENEEMEDIQKSQLDKEDSDFTFIDLDDDNLK